MSAALPVTVPLPAWPEPHPADLELRAWRWRAAAASLRLEREGPGWVLLVRSPGGGWMRWSPKALPDLAAVGRALADAEEGQRAYWRVRSAQLLADCQAREQADRAARQARGTRSPW